MINMFHNNVETVIGWRLLKTSTVTSFCWMPAVISLLHRIFPPRLKSKICFNCTEPLHSSALRCCNVMQYNAWYAAQYAVQYLYCIICKTMQYNAKSADLKLFVVGQSRFFCSNCSSKIWLNPTIIHEMNAQRKVLKRSKVETTLEQLVLLGTARCKERSSNNYQLITA